MWRDGEKRREEAEFARRQAGLPPPAELETVK
jgi:hypothetical protein